MKITSFALLIALVLPLWTCSPKEDKPDEKKEEKKEVHHYAEFPNQTSMEHDISWKADVTKAEIRDGKFWQDGKWRFLKIGKPLHDLSEEWGCDIVRNNLKKYKELGYDVLELRCYWYYFDKDGDGVPDQSLEPMKKLFADVYKEGMFPCLGVETYSVGGGEMPVNFFENYPDAEAINSKGKPVIDEEYGTGFKVVDIYNEQYRKNVHTFIESLCRGLGEELNHVLWFETTCEPQYTGDLNNKVSYSESARKEYAKWREANGITDKESEMPEGFPMPDSFVNNATWNRFRAEFLAKWVNDDADCFKRVFKEITGRDGLVAADFLCALPSNQMYRDGDPQIFMDHLTSADIIQVNWHWHPAVGGPNKDAYKYVRNAMQNNGRKDWVISEHMTFNGMDYTNYTKDEIDKMLKNILDNGTRFGWEFTNLIPSTDDPFCVYASNFKPKRPLSYLENDWDKWLEYIWEKETSGLKPID